MKQEWCLEGLRANIWAFPAFSQLTKGKGTVIAIGEDICLRPKATSTPLSKTFDDAV